MEGEIAKPLTNLDNAGCRDEEPGDNFVLKKCLLESRENESFNSDQSQQLQVWPRPNVFESLPDSPVSWDEDADPASSIDDHDGTIVWTNPAFCSGHDVSDDSESLSANRSPIGSYRDSASSESVYGRKKPAERIRDNFNSPASSQFALKSKLRGCRISAAPINISVNVTVGGFEEYQAVYRANRTSSERARRAAVGPDKTSRPFAKNAAPGNVPARGAARDRGGRVETETVLSVKEEEAKIRAELAREIEKSLEAEIKQQISKLNRRLEELHAHQKSETAHQTCSQSSAFRGLRDDSKIKADDPGKKFDWVKTLRSGPAETDNHNNANLSVIRRRRPQAPISESSAADCSFHLERAVPERSKSEPRRRRAPPKSFPNCNSCKSEDDIAVGVSQMRFSQCGLSNSKGNFDHSEQSDKLKMNRSAAAAKNDKVVGKILAVGMVNNADRICDGASVGQNKAKKVQFSGGKLLPTSNQERLG